MYLEMSVARILVQRCLQPLQHYQNFIKMTSNIMSVKSISTHSAPPAPPLGYYGPDLGDGADVVKDGPICLRIVPAITSQRSRSVAHIGAKAFINSHF